MSQSDESHAKSRCEQQERGGTHHSTQKAALCVGGTRGDDESEGKHNQRDPREGVEERVQSGSTRGKVREWARDVGQDGLVPSGETVMVTSRAHGARKNGSKLAAEKPEECQDDKSTTCGRKKARGNREAQMNSSWNQSGQ